MPSNSYFWLCWIIVDDGVEKTHVAAPVKRRVKDLLLCKYID